MKCGRCLGDFGIWQCPLCGRWVCEDCWDYDEDLCRDCAAQVVPV